MTLKECYAALGGDYDEAMGRLRSEKLVQKFVLKFLNDGSYRLLCDSLASGDRDEAFRAGVQRGAHRGPAGREAPPAGRG